jgi:hypothetical protein
VRGGPKTIVAVAAALLLALGVSACGGGDDSGSTAAETQASAQAGSGAGSSQEASKEPSEGKSGGGDSSSSGSGSEAGANGSGGDEGSGKFVPKQHQDSGGGSAQFKVKGGDNSVQEFGAESGGSELAAASTALHNFLDARAAGDWAAACEYMSKTTIQSLEQLATHLKQAGAASCGQILGKLTNPAAMGELRKEAEEADVGSLRTEGEQAFVIYTANSGTVMAMPMADEGGTWKVASLAGTPLS